MKASTKCLASLLLVCSSYSISFAGRPDSNSDSTSTKSSKLKLPVIAVGTGLLNFVGDVGYSHANEPLLAPTGFNIEIQNYTQSRLSFSLFLLSGKVRGEQKHTSYQLNFETSLLNEGLTARYEFKNKNPKQVFIPFITAGIEYVIFHSKADLKDANGNTYNYWSDGSIRNLPESDTGAANAMLLYRDYKYETDLVEADLDGLGKTKSTSFGFPVGAGGRLRFSSRCSADFGIVCHFIQTDMLDGISEESTGNRQGNSLNDKVIYSSVAFRYALSAPRDVPKRKGSSVTVSKEDVKDVDFEALAKEDADKDGVADPDDMSSDTPAGVQVDQEGKPLDSDNDGIPDYKDKEANSAADAMVNVEGVTITDEMILEKARKDSLENLPRVIEYIKSYDREIQRSPTVSKSATIPPGNPVNVNDIPEIYKRLDTNKDGEISPTEISDAIDEYLNGKSPYNVSQFYGLIDFFFIQK